MSSWSLELLLSYRKVRYTYRGKPHAENKAFKCFVKKYDTTNNEKEKLKGQNLLAAEGLKQVLDAPVSQYPDWLLSELI